MKKSLLKVTIGNALLLVVFAVIFNACWDENIASKSTADAQNSPTTARRVYNTNFDIVQSTVGTTWTYVITSDGKNPGHFIIDLGSCGDQSAALSNIVSATV